MAAAPLPAACCPLPRPPGAQPQGPESHAPLCAPVCKPPANKGSAVCERHLLAAPLHASGRQRAPLPNEKNSCWSPLASGPQSPVPPIRSQPAFPERSRFSIPILHPGPPSRFTAAVLRRGPPPRGTPQAQICDAVVEFGASQGLPGGPEWDPRQSPRESQNGVPRQSPRRTRMESHGVYQRIFPGGGG